jgi:hypothetical protein
MSEPERLIHDPDLADELRLSLQARAQSPELPEAIKARVRQRLAATLLLPSGAEPMSQTPTTSMPQALSSGTLSSTPSAGLTVAGVVKAVSVTVVGASLTAGVGALVLSSPPKTAPLQPSTGPTGSTVHLSQQTHPRPELPSEAAGGVVTQPTSASVERSPAKLGSAAQGKKPDVPRTPGAPAGTEQQRMLLEANALRAAKAVLGTSPSTALQLLDEQARTYPHSQLAVERKVLRLRALVALGQEAQARQVAEALLLDPRATMYHSRAKELLDLGAVTEPTAGPQ